MKALFTSVKQLVELAELENKPISEIMVEQEVAITKKSCEAIIQQMNDNLQVMEEAIERGLYGVESTSGLTGGDAVLFQAYITQGNALSGELLLDVVIEAMHKIGQSMPSALRETAKGGLATTPTGKAWEEKIFGEGK